MPRLAVIGAGAAGCLGAIELKRRRPDVDVSVFEAGSKPLAKVALTGGGRCNLTNTFDAVGDLREVYPRGFQLMKRALHHFGPGDTRRWFEAEGVRLVEEDGGLIFPASGDAMQIVRCLLRALDREGVRIRCRHRVTRIQAQQEPQGFEIRYATDAGTGTEGFDAVLIATGGSPKRSGLDFTAPLGLAIEEPVPSLFTLKIEDAGLRALMGISVPDAILSLPGTRFKACAPLLLTDWGIGGPATLRLSSYAARHLAEAHYRVPIAINWTGANESEVRTQLSRTALQHKDKLVLNACPFPLPGRLWAHILSRSGARQDLRWAELGAKGTNRFVSTLTNDPYTTAGRAAFKEEFVTCGGISLSCIDPATLGAKNHPGLFLAGEALDIDAVTGGFNLQAAWTTGWICARSAAAFLDGKASR